MVAALGLGFAGHALAEDFKTPPRKIVDPLGVDLPSGAPIRDDTLMSIGDPAAGGLAWVFHSHYTGIEGDFRGSLGSACTDPPPIFSDPSCDPYLTYSLLWIGEGATTFNPNGSGWDNWSGTGSSLVTSGGNLLYSAEDGTLYTINTTSNQLTSIKHPNGMVVTLNYASGVLVSAVSNTGFAFRFGDGAGNKTVFAINLLAHSGCGVAQLPDLTCAITTYDSKITLSGALLTFQITDPAGKVWKYGIKKKFSYMDHLTSEIISGPRVLWSYSDPTGYGMSTTRATRGGLTGVTIGTVTSTINDTITFEYTGQGAYAEGSEGYTNYTCQPHVHTTGDCTGTSPNLVYLGNMNEGSGMAFMMKDALGRETDYDFTEYDHGASGYSGMPIAPWNRLTGVLRPEGDKVDYTYDARGNVTYVLRTGAGTSPQTQSFTASFPSTCTNTVTCNQPTYTRDALGNQTDYTYDSTHGGVLTVVLPADQDGLRQKTFNTYTAYDTDPGAGVSNIYRLTRSETCGLTSTQLSTLTACPAAVATSVTITDYGTSTTAPYTYRSFQPYSVTKTDGAGSLSATTTYGYDIVGDVVMTDGPRTDVSDVSYATYDVNRRVVCEISPDPDGASSLVRLMVRHVYDDAGREIETDTGTGSSTTGCTPGAEMTRANYKLMTYDNMAHLAKTQTVVTP